MALHISDTLGTQQGCLVRALDAFGYRAQSKALGKSEQMAKKDPALGSLRQIPHQRAIDLDDVDRQDLQMPQRGMSGAEIVERDAAAEPAQRVNKACRLLNVAECRRFRDLDD